MKLFFLTFSLIACCNLFSNENNEITTEQKEETKKELVEVVTETKE